MLRYVVRERQPSTGNCWFSREVAPIRQASKLVMPSASQEGCEVGERAGLDNELELLNDVGGRLHVDPAKHWTISRRLLGVSPAQAAPAPPSTAKGTFMGSAITLKHGRISARCL